MSDDLFKSMATTKAHTKDSYFAPGRYLCELLAVKRITSDKPTSKGRTKIVAEFRVVDVVDAFAADANYPASNPAGDRCAVVLDVEGPYADSARVELREILTAALVAKGVRVPGTDRTVAAPGDLDADQWAAMAPRMVSGFTYADKSGAPHVTATPSPHVAGAYVEVTAVRRAKPSGTGKWYTSMRYVGRPQ
jgi:hypothetical protein